MSRGMVKKVLVALMSAGLCAAMTGCSLSPVGDWLRGQGEGRENELEKGREAGTGPPEHVVAAVNPRAEPEVKDEAPVMLGEAGDYRVILSFSDLGVVEIVLEGEDTAAGAWRSADAEALKRCRAWGYEDADGNRPLERVRLYRCQGKVASRGQRYDSRAKPALWRTHDFRSVLWNFRSRAERGDEKALKMVRGMAAQRDFLERRADRGNAKAWTAWIFSEVMASDGEVRADAWRCFPRGKGRGSEQKVMLGRLSEAGAEVGVGEVSAFGASHPAVFRTVGPALRWDFGTGHWRQLPHAFVIEPDGDGYHFDVSSAENGREESRRHFDCEVLG